MRFILLLFATLASVPVHAQCAKDRVLTWDDKAHDFMCEAKGAGALPIDHSKPGTTFESDKNKRDFCEQRLTNLLHGCPTGLIGADCRRRAVALNAECVRGVSADVKSGPNAPLRKTDARVCRANFAVMAKACQQQKKAIAAHSEPRSTNTCLADAIADRDDCLALSK